jgi:hypothetical protein
MPVLPIHGGVALVVGAMSSQHVQASSHRPRNHEGVILDYCDPSDLRPHHVQRVTQVSDRRRNALIAAERELLTMAVIFDHIELSQIARTRLDDGLQRIRKALSIRRADYSMAVEEAS